MKNIFYSLLALVIAFGLSGCEDDKEIPYDVNIPLKVASDDGAVTIDNDKMQADITIAPLGSSATFEVETDQSWRLDLESLAGWCDVTYSGNTVTVKGEEFVSEFRRQTVFSVVGQNNKIFNITVKQAGTDAATLELEYKGVVFPEDGGERTFDVITNMDTFTVTGHENVEWLDVEVNIENKQLTVYADRNTVEEELTEVLTVTAGSGINTWSEEFTVVLEEWKPTFVYTEERSVTLSPEGSEIQVDIHTNRDNISVAAADNWLSASIKNGRLALSAPETDQPRISSVVITATGDIPGDNDSYTLTVRQAGGSFRMEVTVTAGTKFILPARDQVDITVDWGDGSSEETFAGNYSGHSTAPSHTYSAAGTYEISIKGTIRRFTIEADAANDATRSAITGITAWADLGIYDMTRGFAGTAISRLPDNAQFMLGGVETFNYIFSGCNNLTTIPADLFAGAYAGVEFVSIFENCKNITSVPAGLFDDCTALYRAQSAFQGCTKLTSVADNLFSNCAELFDGQSVFAGCTALTSTPRKLFSGCSELVWGSGAFDGCSNLTSIDEDIFEGCSGLRLVSNTFANCPITTIPEGLFRDCVVLDQMYATFIDTKITSIPGGLFENCHNLDYVSQCFNGTQITEVPAGLFKNKPLTVAIGTFANCTQLLSVHDEAFAGCTELSSLVGIFENCVNLTTIPVNLFSEATELYVMARAFSGCSSLRGSSPVTQNGLKLWQRNYGNGYRSISNYDECFKGCTNLDDYSSIPNSWK